MTVSNMKTAAFIWLILAAGLFLSIFYYHPKSFTGIVPFRTVSVVAQVSGPVTKIYVKNGSRVRKGDLLFKIEDSSQKTALKEALVAFQAIDAAEAKEKKAVLVAKANVAQLKTALIQFQSDLAIAEDLLRKKVGRANIVTKRQSSVAKSRSALAASRAKLSSVRTELTDVLPARRKAAEATYASRKAEFDKTEVRAFSAGVVTQMLLSVGSPASRLIISPALLIIPDREKDKPVRILAGFSQVSYNVLHVGMPAEIACDSNSNITLTDTVIPARVVWIQQVVAAGQVAPGRSLIDPASRARRGSILVAFELVHKQHETRLLDGSGCIVQTYTNNLHGTFGHIIAGTGAVKALLLRVKAWGVLISGVGLAGKSY